MDANMLQALIQIIVQILALVGTSLMLYYRLKGQGDSNAKDIKNILEEMNNNGFIHRGEFEREINVSKEQRDILRAENERARNRIDFLEGVLIKGISGK